MADPAVRMLASGIDSLAGVIARTHGPVAGQILVSNGGGRPEVLDDSGVLARRITSLDSPSDHAGVMAVREMCLAMRRRYGDGSATAAVLARELVRAAARLTVAGANPMAVRSGIDRGVAAACEALVAGATPINSADELSRLATGATHDPDIGAVVGELFDILGKHAGLIIEERTVPGIDRAYIEGARWRARPAYRGVIPEGSTELTMHDPLVVVADAKLTDPEDVVLALEAAATSRRPLMLVSRGIEGAAKTCLQRNRSRVIVAPVCLASGASQLRNDLDDLALICSATVLVADAGRAPHNLDPSQVGRAQRVVLHKDRLVIHGGAGDAQSVQRRADEVLASVGDPAGGSGIGGMSLERGSDAWRKMRNRVARLTGSMGVILVGGYTDSERKQQVELVRKAQRVLELALENGSTAGGGAAYLDCVQAVLATRENCSSTDESWGVETVASALTAPFRQIVSNYGSRYDGPHPAVALERVTELGAGWGFDAHAGDYVQMTKAGVLDSVGVLQGALQAAGSLAGSVITAAGVVRARRLEVS